MNTRKLICRKKISETGCLKLAASSKSIMIRTRDLKPRTAQYLLFQGRWALGQQCFYKCNEISIFTLFAAIKMIIQ